MKTSHDAVDDVTLDDTVPPHLILFVASDALTSADARSALDRLIQRCAAQEPVVEIVNVDADPERAQEHDVFVVPTLMRLSPAPEARVVGDLSETDEVLIALQLPRLTAGPF